MNNKKFTRFLEFIGFIVLKNSTNSKNSINSITALCCLLFALLICIPSLLEAKVTGVCSNCHTMHNSQNGSAVARGDAPWGGTGGSTDARPNLLVASCLGCHSSTGSETIVTFDSNKIPIVFNTGGYPAKPLAGGNFYWVQTDDTKGHNIFATNPENTLNPVMAPGNVAGNCGTNNCHYTLDGTSSGMTGFEGLDGRQGCTKCHMVNSYGPPRGYHHLNDGTGTKYVETGAKGWYRFLRGHYSAEDDGVVGIEDEDWQYNPTANDHNEYLGVPGTQDSSISLTNHNMTAYCCGCHGLFHVQDTTPAGASPWIRHPEDIAIPNLGEYAAISTTYNPDVPVARSSAFMSGLGNTPDGTVQAGRDMVMCLSCHRAHASPYFKMMRWDYNRWPKCLTEAPLCTINGCNVCHTTKG